MSLYLGRKESLLRGVRELDAQLAELGDMGPKVLRAATRAAMKPVYDAAHAAIPVGTKPHRLTKTYGRRLVAPGFAKRSLRLKSGVSKDKSSAWATVGVADPAFYVVQFTEYGFKSVPPKPWLSPTFKANRNVTVGALNKELAKAIKKAIRKKQGAVR